MHVFMTGATGEIGRRAVPLMIAVGCTGTATHCLRRPTTRPASTFSE